MFFFVTLYMILCNFINSIIIKLTLHLGVVPITCEELFKGIESKRASSKSETFEVDFLSE